jgi:hypothetical protein
MAEVAVFLAAKFAMGFPWREDWPALKLSKTFFILLFVPRCSFLAFLREAHSKIKAY